MRDSREGFAGRHTRHAKVFTASRARAIRLLAGLVACLGALSCEAKTGAPDASSDVEDVGDNALDSALDSAPDSDAPADGVPDTAVDTDASWDPETEPIIDTTGDGCVPVESPLPVPLAPLEAEPVPGTSEAVTEDGFHDEFVRNSAGTFKVGVRREWGGTIVFFGQTGTGPGINSTNVIDANDTGREVQVAFYDPDRHMQNCAADASCATEPSDCPMSITYLGWDPVQGGNRCNIGSGVNWLYNTGGAIGLSTTPLFWNPNWDFTDCTSTGCTVPALRDRRSDVEVHQTLRFVRTHVVELTYEVVNLADIDHAATEQEMPTVYTANGEEGTQDLWRLFDSDGTQVAIDTPAGGDGFYYENFTSPGGWVSMQNDAASYGVGIFYENMLQGFQGWQLRSLPFNNVRARFSFGIPASGTVFARAYLILGSLDSVAAEAAWLDAGLPPFGVIDAPTDDEPLTGTVTVRGWALDNDGVASMELWVDGAPATALAYGQSRPDVCLVWPGYRGCDDVGYSGTFDFSTLSSCQHLIEVRATDTDGNVRVIARRRVMVTD